MHERIQTMRRATFLESANMIHHTQYQNYNTTLAEDFQEREIGKLNNYTKKL